MRGKMRKKKLEGEKWEHSIFFIGLASENWWELQGRGTYAWLNLN